MRFLQTIDKEPSKKISFQKQFFNKTSKILKKYNINTNPLINHQLADVITLAKYKSIKEDLTGIVYKLNCKKFPSTYIEVLDREPL